MSWEADLRAALCIYCRRGIKRYRGCGMWMHAYHDPEREPERERYTQCDADPRNDHVKRIRAVVRKYAVPTEAP